MTSSKKPISSALNKNQLHHAWIVTHNWACVTDHDRKLGYGWQGFRWLTDRPHPPSPTHPPTAKVGPPQIKIFPAWCFSRILPKFAQEWPFFAESTDFQNPGPLKLTEDSPYLPSLSARATIYNDFKTRFNSVRATRGTQRWNHRTKLSVWVCMKSPDRIESSFEVPKNAESSMLRASTESRVDSVPSTHAKVGPLAPKSKFPRKN